MTETSDRELVSTGEAIAVLATFAAGAALVVVRGQVDSAVIVLILTAVVCACGALGGVRAGVASAVAASLSFNFFHTEPYLSLRIHDVDDVVTTLAMVVVGMIAGVTSSVANRRQERAFEAGTELAAIERVAELVAEGRDPADVVTAVRAELLDLLGLVGCRYQASTDGRSVLGPHGALTDAVRTYHDGGFELPARGVAIGVRRRGETIGHLVCDPTPGRTVSAARRRAAVALADLLGAAVPPNSTLPRS